MAAETITVLFTDLVGSTELLSRVGEAQADELRREHFGLLRAAIDEAGGREVKNLGDGLMVAFDGVNAGLDAAVAMQQAMAARPASSEPMEIRIGVAAGEAEVEDGDYFGLPVVEAARLCAKAGDREILTTELVRMLARSRSRVEFESVGALELKGLDEPVEAYRVVWAPIERSDERPPLPARLASSVAPNFVGRSEEHEQLVAAWKAVTAQGERRVLLVSGEPGIGKTTLSARFACEVYEAGAVVVYGRCDEDLGIPYQPWIEALTQLVASAPENLLAEHVADRGGHLARLVPEMGRRIPVEVAVSGEGDAERFVLFGCVTDLLERLAHECPVLVVLDDLHWTDRASVQLLRHVATTDRPMPLAILGTFRDSEITADHPLTDLLAALHRERGSDRIALRGFDDNDLLALLELVAGHGMDDEGVALRDAILAETAGNPFFVGEILRHLSETGAIYQRDDGRWVGESDIRAVGLPVSVREVVGRRIAALGIDTERILGLGAVIGRDFDIALLAAVAKIDEDTVIDLCDAAVGAAVLQPTTDRDRYTFAHALIEHTLYDGLSPARRARAHRVVAECIEAPTGSDERAGELAYHWAQAVQPTDSAKAIHYAQVAGSRALAQLAPDEAVRWYRQALELLDRGDTLEPRDRAEILIGLGDAERQCGIGAHREHLLEAARLADAIDAVGVLVRAVLANSRGWASDTGQTDHERIRLIRRAIDRFPAPDDPDRARLLGTLATELIYDADLDERLAIAQEGISVARRSGDIRALHQALHRACASCRGPSTLRRRSEWVDEACVLADQLHDPPARSKTYGERVNVALEAGDPIRLWESDAIERSAMVGIPVAAVHWTHAFGLAWQAVLRGDLPEAEQLAELALEIGVASDQPDAFTIYGAQLVNIRHNQGRWDEVVPLIEQALADMPALHVYRAVLARAYTYTDDPARATPLLADAVVSGFSMREDNSWTTAASAWAEAVVRLNNRDAAASVRELLMPYHAHIVTSGVTVGPALAHNLGMLDHLLGRFDDAETWFTEAMEIAERMESPLLAGYTQAAWAALLVDRAAGDDLDRAQTMAESALAAATAGGYGYIEADASAVLEQLG